MRRELVMFLAVGAATTSTHIAVAIILETLLNLSAQRANFGGYVSAVVLSYFGHGKLTFRGIENHAIHIPRFIVVSLFGLTIGAGLIEILAGRNEMPFVYAMVIAGVAVASTTFLLSKFWAFAHSQLSPKK